MSFLLNLRIMIVRVHNTSSLNSGYRSWKSGMGNQRLAMETSKWPFWIKKGVLTPKPCFQNKESSSSLFHIKPWKQLQMLNFRDRRDRWSLFPPKKHDFCTLILPGTKVGCTVGRETSLRTKGVAYFPAIFWRGFCWRILSAKSSQKNNFATWVCEKKIEYTKWMPGKYHV